MSWILRGVEAVDSPLAGGKARALASMERGGLPVPPWFVVSASAFEESLSGDHRIALETARDDSASQPLLRDLSVHPAIRTEIDAAVRELCPGGERVAVRSSARDEDGAQQSFAGQLESFLNVPAEEVANRVADVWRSAFSRRLFAYRQKHGLRGPVRAPAVLIQQMVAPRAAGVAFSADPVSGRRAVSVVSAVHGLGSALVGGETEADTWLTDRAGTIIERRVVQKDRMPCLSDEEVLTVVRLAKAAERRAGRPQDIEWAYADRLVLLQSRPITSLHTSADPDAPATIWDNSNIVESYSGVTTPLTFSFARDAYEHVYQQFCRMMGVPERVITAREETFANMLGLVRGRLYYNLLNWYRMLALLPGYRVNRGFMEQMMGVKEPLPPDLAARVAGSTTRGRVRDAISLMRTLGGLLINLLTVDRQVKAFSARIDDALKPPSPPLEDRRPDELVAHYRELRRKLLRRWDAPIVNDFFAMIFYGLLRQLVTRWLGDADAALQNDLIGSQGGIVSAEPAVRLRRLAVHAADDPVLVERLKGGAVEEILMALDSRPELREEYRAYLERFGERTVNELKLESATLHDDPLPLFRAVGVLASQLARAGNAGLPSSPADDLRVKARARVTRLLRNRPVRRIVFNWVLSQARCRVRDRENLRLERTRLFGRVRRIFLALGRRLHALDILDDPRDVLYLEVNEVLAFVDGTSTCTNLRSLAALRKAEFLGFQAMDAPDDRFETRGAVYQGHDFRQPRTMAAHGGEERRGVGCSPGVVRGRVRVVTDPNAADMSERAILVAEHTDPGWIMLFPSALAILVERGSLLSHAAIVARELGIPAVVSVPGLTRWLQDGETVEMDGTTGIIRRINVTTAAEAARCA